MTEFDIIKNFFQLPFAAKNNSILQGIGDDAAIIAIPENYNLVVSTDTLNVDVHFFRETAPFAIAYKALAVNLSDLAAMGATPKWFLLSLTLPDNNSEWLQEFSAGLVNLAEKFAVQLIGGDTTRGPLAITIQALGLLPKNTGLLRSGAKAHDLIYVSNTIGDAGLALQYLENNLTIPNHHAETLARFYKPEPRVALGQLLLPIASSAIDISDGLIADLKHILEQSNVGARINIDALPLSQALRCALTRDAAVQLALTKGDDYELCFTIPVEKQAVFKQLTLPVSCTCIGEVTSELALTLHDNEGKNYVGEFFGYEHF